MNVMLPKTAAEEALGVSLPHRRMEDWKWTDLRRLVATPYTRQDIRATDTQIDSLIAGSPLAAVKTSRIIFVNGVLDAPRSFAMPSHASALVTRHADDVVLAIAENLMAEGVNLLLEGNTDSPIEILHVVTEAEARAMAVRHHITVANGASATIIETFVGAGDYLSAAVTEITLGEGARLDRIKIEHEGPRSTHLSHVITRLARTAQFRDFTLTSGAAINRQNGTLTFAGEGADARMSGAYLLRDRQHADTRLLIDHAVPHCVSRELFKLVMDDHARGIFQGKVLVRPDAQKTDGKQSSHALLLSETAEFDAKPELEIYADDVVCGHGATSGDLNHDHLFYLMSRGIPKPEARTMLVSAFVNEAIETIEHEGVRDALMTFAEGRLAK